MRIAIVLAGGRSSRFGADKLAADLHGRSLLGASVDAVSRTGDRVVVVGPALPAAHAGGSSPITLVPDRDAFGGPLLALGDALDPENAADQDLAIVVGGDMPGLVPAVLARMLDRLASDPSADAVILGPAAGDDSTGGGTSTKRQVLPLAIRVGAARAAVAAAIAAGDRSLQALVDRLAVVELAASVWLGLDPAGETVLDVDTVADLDRIRAAKGD